MFKTLLNPSEPVNLNGGLTLFSILLLHLVGPQAMIVQPAFVGGLVTTLGFDPAQAGFVAASENTGKLVQSLLMMVLITRVNWRYLFYGALAVLIGGNILCTFITSYEAFRVVRFFTGMATGTIVPLCYVCASLTAKSERNFGLMMSTLMIYAAFVFIIAPSLFESLGFTGLVIFFAAFATLGLPAVRNMPTAGPDQTQTTGDGQSLSVALRGMAICAMFFYFVATFSVWAYFSLIGEDLGLTEQQVGNALTLAQFAGIAGALLVVGIGDRFGRVLPIGLALGSSVAVFLVLGRADTALFFAIVACLFNFLWNLGHPFLLAAQASFDKSGRQVTYATAMQMAGIAAGPALGAFILDRGGNYGQIILGAAAIMTVSLVLIQIPLLKRAFETKNDAATAAAR